jgi:hypothetical protein
VAHRAAEAIEGRDHHDIDPPCLHLAEKAIERWPLLPGPGNALVDEFGRVPPPSRDVRAQIPELRLAGLVWGADARA